MKFPSYYLLLQEYVSFKSVSTDKTFASGIEAMTRWLLKKFHESRFKNVQRLEGPNSNPVVYAEYTISDPTATTILFYGHYDVQPADKAEGWTGDPFVLHIDDKYAVGRGSVDNKGQNLIHLYTAMRLIEEKNLGCNVKFLIEGGEETGSPDIGYLITEYAELLKCDRIIISDGQMLEGDIPTIESSLRGGGNLTITYKTSDEDLHSGLYGGPVPSALQSLIHLLDGMVSCDNWMLMEGAYKGMLGLSPEQMMTNKKISELNNPVKTGLVKALIGDYDFQSAVANRPTMTVTGFSGGYTGIGYKNIIPGTAQAKINFRLVGEQTPEKFVEAFKKHVEENTPAYIEYSIDVAQIYPPVNLKTDTPEVAHIMKLQEKVYGKKPMILGIGAGIPAVKAFQDILGIDTILLSLANYDCNMHGVDERFSIRLIEKGLELSELILKKD
ncbi:MAG TPA: M20/M25/M40 family metallo-hydrolase [Cyclobacteriaceae bacterium]|nr:M20/M25/M40 family metallo-hydrolase [Cyclobacteriaceae bacterium]